MVLALVGVLATGACSDTAGDSTGPRPVDGVRVASFDFPESELLAELYAQLLEADGLPVVRMGRVGPREIVAPALELDHVDLVPEYLGSALQFFGALTTSSDTMASEAALADLLTPRGLVGLAAAAAQDANAIVTSRVHADGLGLSRISDLSAHATTLRFGGTVECPDRPLCLAGLADVYGLQFGEFVPQISLAATAEAFRRDEIDVGLMFTTAAELGDAALVVLEDDLGLQPAENVLPVIRQSALDRWGESVVDALTGIAPLLTTNELREMNRLVSDGSPVAEVAAQWLTSQGLATAE